MKRIPMYYDDLWEEEDEEIEGKHALAKSLRKHRHCYDDDTRFQPPKEDSRALDLGEAAASGVHGLVSEGRKDIAKKVAGSSGDNVQTDEQDPA